jgi:hypothetical protein
MTRVTFTGWRIDLPRVYADLDVLVSCSSNEGTPFTIIEAMAAGCPVVATRVGGVPDLLDDQATGLLVPPAQAEPLVAAILRLLEDRDLAGAYHRIRFARAEPDGGGFVEPDDGPELTRPVWRGRAPGQAGGTQAEPAQYAMGGDRVAPR